MKSCNAIQALAKLHEQADSDFWRGFFSIFSPQVPTLKQLSARRKQACSLAYYQDIVGDELPIIGRTNGRHLFIWPEQLLTFDPVSDIFDPIPLSGIFYHKVEMPEKGTVSRVCRDKNGCLEIQWD